VAGEKGKSSEEEYRRLLDTQVIPELRALQEQARTRRLLAPAVVYGYYPCQSDGNSLIIYRPRDLADPFNAWPDHAGRTPADLTEWVRFTFPRQQKDRHFCIADFFAPAASGRLDVIGLQLVTMGKVASDHSRALFESNNYKDYLYFHGLSVETAEALAEYWHCVMRREMGIGAQDAGEIRKLFSQHYRGSRYSFGYPACPSLEDQTKFFEILRPERIGVELTEEFQLVPEQSTSAIVVHHPEARYFTV
jgi:5-methyltetrahydrofolate--homocysteine methyltransferase